MSGSDIPALGAATSVRQVGEKDREWQQLQLSNFPLLLRVCPEPCGHRLPLIKMSLLDRELLLVVLSETEVYGIKGSSFA